MFHSRQHTVKPGSLVLRLSIREGGAGELFSVETHWTFLRVVLSVRQSALHSFTLEVIAETNVVGESRPVYFAWRTRLGRAFLAGAVG